MNNKDTVEAPERIRLVKREGRFANEWYYPDAVIMPFEKEFQYARVDPPAVPTEEICGGSENLDHSLGSRGDKCVACSYYNFGFEEGRKAR